MGKESRSVRQKAPEIILIAVILCIIIALFCFFLKDILIPFLKLEFRNDVDGARDLLKDRGLLGFLTVTLVEALQMVVIFIPAEFIQISSGLSYPFPIALLLCDLGVCLGASIIFLLVRTLRYRFPILEKRNSTLDRLSSGMHTRSVVLILYLLFFMPIIPFGAICYYGSSKRISYGRYLFTVATGVIPSIVVSNLMGAASRAFIERDLPFWLLIMIIVLLAAALFCLIFLFLDRVGFRDSDRTPDSLVYALLFFVVRIWCRGRGRHLTIDDEPLQAQSEPYLLLCNHGSFYDFYYVSEMGHPRNPAYLVNEYYTTRPVLRTLAKKAGILSKKLFTPGIGAAAGILRTLRAGFPVVIFPEGRLSPDGRSNPIVEPGGAFYRRLGFNLVLVKIEGAYFASPKWRTRSYHAPVHVSVQRVITPTEMQAMRAEALDGLIAETLFTDASSVTQPVYHQKNKAEGLENLLYRCVDCGALYTMYSRGNRITCRNCGAEHVLNSSYHFTTSPQTISAWYDRMAEMERSELAFLKLSCSVHTTVFGANGGKKRRERGVCTLNPEEFTYQSDQISFSIPTASLPALAFSCGKEFELYHKGELYYFYPDMDPQQVARWALAVDLLAEKRRKEETK